MMSRMAIQRTTSAKQSATIGLSRGGPVEFAKAVGTGLALVRIIESALAGLAAASHDLCAHDSK